MMRSYGHQSRDYVFTELFMTKIPCCRVGCNVEFIDRTVNWFLSVRRRLGGVAGEPEDALGLD